MRVRTQIAVVGLIAAGWSAGNATQVRAVMAETQRAERLDITALENAVARDNNDVVSARALAAHYLEQGMLSLVNDTMNRMTPEVQRDGRVALVVARAQERMGDVQAASARVNGAINRCQGLPREVAAGAGCDSRTQTELLIESDALDRMIAWHVTPLSDPSRAALAHELSVRPVHIAL